MLIAQLTDPHISDAGLGADQRYQTAARLQRVVAALLALRRRPDLVVMTGDLVDGGSIAEYRHLRRLLASLDLPTYLIPGNHDDRHALRAVFADHDYLPAAGFLHYALEHWPVRLLGLDTVTAGEEGGTLCNARLQWLEDTLAAQPERPTFIFMHHPPFPTGNSAIDAIGLQGAENLWEVLRHHRQVVHLAAGHVHRPIARSIAGRLCTTAPATAYPMTLDLSAEPTLRLEPGPPALQLHLWQAADGCFVTHTMVAEAP